MRLDQFVSQSLGISRSDAKRMIKHQHIRIDDQRCRDTAQHVQPEQCVYHDDTQLTLPGDYYFILHKPLDMVCSHDDDGYPSALHLLPPCTKKLHFAGRLDANTTGLVLVSSDGQWCHRVSHPNSKKQKQYTVTLAEPLTADAIRLLENGVLLHGEDKPTAPCIIQCLDDHHCTMTLSEGKYHQVRRMFAAVGNHVTDLHRFAIGALDIDKEALVQGHYRPLTAAEVALF